VIDGSNSDFVNQCNIQLFSVFPQGKAVDLVGDNDVVSNQITLYTDAGDVSHVAHVQNGRANIIEAGAFDILTDLDYSAGDRIFEAESGTINNVFWDSLTYRDTKWYVDNGTRNYSYRGPAKSPIGPIPQDESGARGLGATYENNTPFPKRVTVAVDGGGGPIDVRFKQKLVSNAGFQRQDWYENSNSPTTHRASVSGIVPPGTEYKVDNFESETLVEWWEQPWV
jgi:hypothetical protein